MLHFDSISFFIFHRFFLVNLKQKLTDKSIKKRKGTRSKYSFRVFIRVLSIWIRYLRPNCLNKALGFQPQISEWKFIFSGLPISWIPLNCSKVRRSFYWCLDLFRGEVVWVWRVVRRKRNYTHFYSVSDERDPVSSSRISSGAAACRLLTVDLQFRLKLEFELLDMTSLLLTEKERLVAALRLSWRCKDNHSQIFRRLFRSPGSRLTVLKKLQMQNNFNKKSNCLWNYYFTPMMLAVKNHIRIRRTKSETGWEWNKIQRNLEVC